ncbi:hypothetical protein GCK72_018342 [Caenorhabditis remanei]|uniref:Uncharacterized protein n=1 Tax=Caenorhabditis remanei TaxID=31234 RepID=A0A6A5G9I2_CAERE|nr:hypothetical protein GCK72_018342 [Caenorhabditis remanei]KAF1751788.1 hypothetical protein GCK72_018342 [Caenorhabditis remanei]
MKLLLENGRLTVCPTLNDNEPPRCGVGTPPAVVGAVKPTPVDTPPPPPAITDAVFEEEDDELLLLWLSFRLLLLIMSF